MRAALCALAAVATSLPLAARTQAQVLVTTDQNLVFGLLTPGTPAIVPVTDVARRAALTIAARGRFHISFQLPAALTNPATGHTIPLVFGPTDARVEIRQRVAANFDPTAGYDIHLNPADRQASVFLGGRANPVPGQAAGQYTAEIVILVVQTGT
jgi:hypothetical protein